MKPYLLGHYIAMAGKTIGLSSSEMDGLLLSVILFVVLNNIQTV